MLYLPFNSLQRSTSIDFAENQLFPSSIGFSPLASSRPRLLPQTWVRSSKTCYHFFNLLKARSLGFGSSERYSFIAFYTRFIYASTLQFKLAFFTYSLTHYAKGTPLFTKTSVVDHLGGCKLRLIVGIEFQDSFSLPFIGFYFTFPSQYLYTIG